MIDIVLSLVGGATSSAGSVRGVLVRAGRPESKGGPSSVDAPTLVFPAVNTSAAMRAAADRFADLTGTHLRLSEPAPTTEYRFGNTSDLWPFSGLRLAEASPRVVWGAQADESVETLVSCGRGALFLRSTKDARRPCVYVSLVPLPSASAARLLKNELCLERFMGLFPLLTFARLALGQLGWRSGPVGATFQVDDINLRSRRYGFLALEEILEAARTDELHLSMAMVPLDYRKTNASVARLVRDNADRLSVVLHGIDHRRLEFESQVPLKAATVALRQALARMDDHERRTGIKHARAMTFPHEGCNGTWLTAMHNAGFDAALAYRALPFAHETGLGNPLYELHPAETGVAGFPVINRFWADEPVERLLFAAWLGRPLIVCAHHDFFREGLDKLVEITRFLNRCVRPYWCDVGGLLAANYQTREAADGLVVRAFSNRVLLSLGSRPALVGFGTDLMAPVDRPASLDPQALTESFCVSFRPTSRGPDLGRASVISQARRGATELRDRCAPLVERFRFRA